MSDYVVRSVAALRALLSEPSAIVQAKSLPALDHHMRTFIALSPWVDVASRGADGSVDVSPRGDPPGFVQVLADGSLLIPERPGNRQPDWLARLTHAGKAPQFAIHVQVQEAFMHCGRAINRARLWKSDTWPAADALASMAQMLVDQTALPGLEVVALDSMLKTLVTEELY